MPMLNYIDSIGDVSYVILTPRLSRFSACNIENWEEPGDEASMKVKFILIELIAKMLRNCKQS